MRKPSPSTFSSFTRELLRANNHPICGPKLQLLPEGGPRLAAFFAHVNFAITEPYLNSHLLLGLLNAYIVKRQIRSKQFTRDVIDTLGTRLLEATLTIPKSNELKKKISQGVMRIIKIRVEARDEIRRISKEMTS